MKFGNIREVTGRFAKESYEWLEKGQMGCCSICFDSDDRYNYAVCVGWTETGGGTEDAIAWKIGRQTRNNIMQCDFDTDFEMPYSDESGDVDDTRRIIECRPENMLEWSAVAKKMRDEARRVFSQWKEIADDSY